MDVSSIAVLATGMAESATAQAVNIAVMKKVLDAERAGAAALLAAIAPAPVNLPDHLGKTIDTVA